MHTKEELTKKKSLSGEQLDLVESISTDDKIHKKRLFVILSISLTIGLSVIFLAYRSLRNFTFTLPSLPQFSLSSSATPDLTFTDILGKEKSKWNITILSVAPTPHTLVVKPNSVIKNLLPQGITLLESSGVTKTGQEFKALITVPNQQIYIDIQYSSTDKNSFNSTIQRLIPAIYWAKIQST